MRAVIIAAGRGSRLSRLTDDRPKCLITVGGIPLLERAVQSLRRASVSEIIVVRGYRKSSIVLDDVTYVDNEKWHETEVLASILSARDYLQGETLIIYSDIIFSDQLLRAALDSQGAIAPVVDVDWRVAYEGRVGHPLPEADKVALYDDGSVRHIGKLGIRHEDAHAEFVGMLRLSSSGVKQLLEAYDAAARFGDGPFMRAPSFARAYLTDLLQNMINNGYSLQPVVVRGGWREIDTEEDLERARAWWDAR